MGEGSKHIGQYSFQWKTMFEKVQVPHPTWKTSIQEHLIQSNQSYLNWIRLTPNLFESVWFYVTSNGNVVNIKCYTKKYARYAKYQVAAPRALGHGRAATAWHYADLVYLCICISCIFWCSPLQLLCDRVCNSIRCLINVNILSQSHYTQILSST